MINYPAVSADWQTLTGSRPTMCLPQVCCITDSSRPSLDPTIISPAALSNPLGDGCCYSSFLHLPNSSQPQGPLSLRFSRSLSESHSVGCENHRLAPPHPAAGGLKLRPRSLDAPTQTQTTTRTNMSRVDVCCTRGIKQADVKAHMAAFSRRRPLASF